MGSDSTDDSSTEERIDRLESVVKQQNETIREMLPGRRAVLAGAGAAALGFAGGSGSASGQSAVGQVGTSSEPVDVEAASVNAGSVNTELLSNRHNTKTPYDNRRDIAIGTQIDPLVDLSDWTVESGSVSSTTAESYRGDSSLQFDVPGSGQSVISRSFDPPRDYRDVDLSLALLPSTGGLEINITATDQSGSQGTYAAIMEGAKTADIWHRMDLTPTNPQLDEPDIDRSRISSIEISIETFGSTGTTVFVSDLRKLPRPTDSTGWITIQFDDGWEDVYETAYPIMEDYGLIGTVGVITSAVGNTDYMDENQLRELYDAGWDMASHSHNHDQFTNLGPEDTREDLKTAKQELLKMGFSRGSNHLIYPYGRRNETVITDGQTWYDFGYHIGGALTDPSLHVKEPSDAFNISRTEMSNNPVSSYKRMADKVARWGLVGHFYLHDINGSFQDLTESEFEEFCAHVSGRDDLQVTTPSRIGDDIRSGIKKVDVTNSTPDGTISDFDRMTFADLNDEWGQIDSTSTLQSNVVAEGNRAWKKDDARRSINRTYRMQRGRELLFAWSSDASLSRPYPRMQFLRQDDNNFFAADFDVENNNIELNKTSSGNLSTLDSTNATLQAGEWYYGKIRTTKDTVSVEVFDAKFDHLGVVGAEDSDWGTGLIATDSRRTEHPLYWDALRESEITL